MLDDETAQCGKHMAVFFSCEITAPNACRRGNSRAIFILINVYHMKLLKFWAQWCGPCKQQALLLKDFKDAEVVSIDIEDEANEPLVLQYGIRNLPTLILTDNEGKTLERFSGLTQPDRIREAIESHA